MQSISRDEVKDIVDSRVQVTLVDATPRENYNAGHIPGALSIPVDQIEELASSLLEDKNEKIVTYCASTQCPASTRAAEKLEKLGYTDVNEYKPGIQDWKQAGFPLEKADDEDRTIN